MGRSSYLGLPLDASVTHAVIWSQNEGKGTHDMTETTTPTTLEAARANLEAAREAYRAAKRAAWDNRFNRNARSIVVDDFESACRAYDEAEAAYDAILANQ